MDISLRFATFSESSIDCRSVAVHRLMSSFPSSRNLRVDLTALKGSPWILIGQEQQRWSIEWKHKPWNCYQQNLLSFWSLWGSLKSWNNVIVLSKGFVVWFINPCSLPLQSGYISTFYQWHALNLVHCRTCRTNSLLQQRGNVVLLFFFPRERLMPKRQYDCEWVNSCCALQYRSSASSRSCSLFLCANTRVCPIKLLSGLCWYYLNESTVSESKMERELKS